MNKSRFDSWTRRRFGLAVGPAAGALVSMAGIGADAKKKKKTCKTCCTAVRGSCSSSSECCEGSICAQRQGIENIAVCCIPEGSPCSNIPGSQLECCGTLECSPSLVCATPV